MAYYSTQDNLDFIPLTVAEEKSLFQKFYAGCLDSRDEIVRRHLKLTAKLALMYNKGILEDEDAISAGNQGLMQALNSKAFDLERGFRFGSYYRTYVRGQVMAMIRFHMPFKFYLTVNSHGEFIDGKEACMRVSIARDRYHDGDKSINYEGICKNFSGPTVDHGYADEQLACVRLEAVMNATGSLSRVEKATIVGFYFQGKTLADVGRENNMSREGARKAYNRALAKLKDVLAPICEEILN